MAAEPAAGRVATPPVRRGLVPRWTVRALAGVHSVPRAAWDALARRGFHRYRWFEAAEACGWRARHVAILDRGELRAVIPAYLHGDQAHADPHRRALDPLTRAARRAGVDLRPALVVGPPLAGVSDPVGEMRAVPPDALEAALGLLELLAAADGARAVVWPALGAEAAAIVTAARRRGYTAAASGSTARLEVGWRDLDAYVASQGERAGRAIRADLAALNAAGIRTEAAHDWRHAADAAAQVCRESCRRGGGREPRLLPDLFAELAALPTPGVWAQLTWRGARLVGFTLNLEADGVVDAAFAAAADVPERAAISAQQLVYHQIAAGVAAGYRRLELGPRSLSWKRLRGGSLHPRVTLIRGATRPLRAVLHALSLGVNWRSAWIERRLG
ncbi:MAG TPA: peptidogalycan biosysnthesis protein [Gemmatimonadales bacterium]|nr:peptidogalycan biosysnthesis protein [Gemmatimonadales bacterium]